MTYEELQQKYWKQTSKFAASQSALSTICGHRDRLKKRCALIGAELLLWRNGKRPPVVSKEMLGELEEISARVGGLLAVARNSGERE